MKDDPQQDKKTAADWLPGEVAWSAPTMFTSFNPRQANGRRAQVPRLASLVGPKGERLYLN